MNVYQKKGVNFEFIILYTDVENDVVIVHVIKPAFCLSLPCTAKENLVVVRKIEVLDAYIAVKSQFQAMIKSTKSMDDLRAEWKYFGCFVFLEYTACIVAKDLQFKACGKKILNQWRTCISNPEYSMCENRLKREASELYI